MCVLERPPWRSLRLHPPTMPQHNLLRKNSPGMEDGTLLNSGGLPGGGDQSIGADYTWTSYRPEGIQCLPQPTAGDTQLWSPLCSPCIHRCRIHFTFTTFCPHFSCPFCNSPHAWTCWPVLISPSAWTRNAGRDSRNTLSPREQRIW